MPKDGVNTKAVTKVNIAPTENIIISGVLMFIGGNIHIFLGSLRKLDIELLTPFKLRANTG